MAQTITLPKLSPTMESGVISSWHKKEGELVQEGELLIEVATDKATVEYTSPEKGYLRKIIVEAGVEAQVNQPIAILTETAEESIENYQPEWGGDGKAPPKQPEVAVTQKPSKAAAPPAPRKEVPKVVLPARPKAEPRASREAHDSGYKPRIAVKASPLARKLAAERRLDLSSVVGSGPGGRVVARDLEHAKPISLVAFGRIEEPAQPAGAYVLESMSPMRRAIGRRLLESKVTIPHFYLSVEVLAGPLVALREQLLASGVKVTFNDLILRATALALRQHPEINSGFDAEQEAIIRYQSVDICVAVSIPDGLITPIITDADTKHVGKIAEEVKELAQKAKQGQLAPHEYQGGSFTVTNLGMYGTASFMPIINPPQAAILGIGAIRGVPVVNESGEVVAGKVMTLTLSADHRVIDGADTARFAKTLQGLLEAPAGLLVGGGPVTKL